MLLTPSWVEKEIQYKGKYCAVLRIAETHTQKNRRQSILLTLEKNEIKDNILQIQWWAIEWIRTSSLIVKNVYR